MIDRILNELFAISIGVIAANTIAIPLLHCVAEERGKFAVGGEWFIIIGVFAIVYWAIRKRNKNTERNEVNENEN